MKKVFLMFILVFFNSTYSFADLTEGLVGHYRFDGNAYDESVNKNHGIVNGNIIYVEGVLNKAAYISTNQDSILINHINEISFQKNQEYTTSILVNLDDYVPNEKYSKIFFKGIKSVGANYTLEMLTLDEKQYIYLNSDTRIVFDHPVNRWMHVVSLFRKNSGFEMYINGIKIDLDTSSTRHFFTSNTFLTIGNAIQYSNSYQWSGKVDDFRIYNRALSDSEIQDLLNTYSAVTGCIKLKNNPIQTGKATLMQSGHISQTVPLDANGCYNFFRVNEEEPFSVMVRKTQTQN